MNALTLVGVNHKVEGRKEIFANKKTNPARALLPSSSLSLDPSKRPLEVSKNHFKLYFWWISLSLFFNFFTFRFDSWSLCFDRVLGWESVIWFGLFTYCPRRVMMIHSIKVRIFFFVWPCMFFFCFLVFVFLWMLSYVTLRVSLSSFADLEIRARR